MIDAILADLRDDEGWDPFPYEDSLGFLTIGYGFLIDKKKGGGLPRPVAEFWLRYAINERLERFRKLWPQLDSQPIDVQNALANMAYQLGPNGLFAFRKMLAALEAGNRELAAAEALDSTWAKQTPARALRVAALIRG